MRDAITRVLNIGERTAKQIAAAAGVEVKDVLKELNAMLRDGVVEREKRGGNEYAYWLTTPANPAAKEKIKITVDLDDPGDSEGGDADLRRQIADLAHQLDQTRRSEAEKHVRMLQATEEAERLRNELAAALIDRDALREQLDAIPTVEAHTAGYLIRAPKRRPVVVTKAETAVARAMAAARNGSGRADVFALVLTGTARRGAEWRPA